MDAQCDHTLSHVDRQGKLQGSWTEELVVDSKLCRRLRIVCRSCGRFYGYLRNVDDQAELPPLCDSLQKVPSVSSQPGKGRPAKYQAESPISGTPCGAPDTRVRRGGIDYKELRRTVSMRDVLRLIRYRPTSTHGYQLRGPCPVHGSKSTGSRSFSVDLRGERFQCFKPSCGVKGNQLDLWVAVTQKPLFEAAVDLCDKMQIEPPRSE
jgi:hypothetical protein